MSNSHTLKRAASLLRGVALVLLGCLVMGQIAPAAATSLGGVQVSTMWLDHSSTRSLTEVSLDWNRGVAHARAPYLTTLTVTPNAGQRLHPGDHIEATVELSDGTLWVADVLVRDETASVELVFDGCEALLTDVKNVALVMTGESLRGAPNISGSKLRGTIDAFSGSLIDTEMAASTEYHTSMQDGSEVLEQVTLALPELHVDELIGQRVAVMLTNTSSQTTVSTMAEIGFDTQHAGAWAQTDEQGARVIVDLALLTSGEAPVMSDIDGYEIMVMRTQHWGTNVNAPGVLSRATTIEVNDPGEDTPPGEGTEPGDSEDNGEPDTPAIPGTPSMPGETSGDGVTPVNLDPRLRYSEPGGQLSLNDPTKLQFCYTFKVTNISSEQVDWSVTFDTTLAPFWGLNPTIVQSDGTGTLHDIWNGKTSAYSSESGHWTITGVDWNRTLSPGSAAEVGFCARAEIPVADASTFDAPVVSVDPSSTPYSVALRVNVTSQSRYFVPWEAEIDLGDYVCPATLPHKIDTENASLTHIEGTRYLLQGSASAGTRFVSEQHPRDFVFARYNPEGKPFEAGACQ